MSSLKSLTQEASTDRPQRHARRLTLRKSYTFFVFYSQGPSSARPSLQRLSFKLREGRESKTDSTRLVGMNFYCLERQDELASGLYDLKQGCSEGRAKLVACCGEQQLLELIDRGYLMEIDMANIPIILTNDHPLSDFSFFAGWNDDITSQMAETELCNYEGLARKWIKSSQEKVDVWTVSIKLEEDGRLERLGSNGWETIEVDSVYEQRFLSHLSLGYHPRLTKKFTQANPDAHQSFSTSASYSWKSFTTFCCLSSTTLTESTGLIDLTHLDEKGQQTQILRHLRQYDGSQESQREASRIVKSDRGIVSLALANIDRFHGRRINTTDCRPNDGKLDLLAFEGSSKCGKLGSLGGQLSLHFEEQTWLEWSLGGNVYRMWGCSSFRVRQCGRIKICISKSLLEC